MTARKHPLSGSHSFSRLFRRVNPSHILLTGKQTHAIAALFLRVDPRKNPSAVSRIYVPQVPPRRLHQRVYFRGFRRPPVRHPVPREKP